MPSWRLVLGRIARGTARGYMSDTALYTGLAVIFLLGAMLWVLALACLYGPAMPPPTEDLAACQPEAIDWWAVCPDGE